MTEAVYILCALTSTACAILLLRAWRRSGGRLLFYSGQCFVWLAFNNSILFIDLVLVPELDLSVLRALTFLIGGMTLLYGLIWDAS